MHRREADEAIRRLETTEDRPPADVDPIWSELVRGSLLSWASELGRDLSRIASALAQGGLASGSDEPSDDHVVALEEALWRLYAATEKVDAIVAIAFTVDGAIRLHDARARGPRFDPSYEANSVRLRAIGSETALRLRQARAALEGERAILRRHQIAHSLAPLVNLHDLASFILVHHRDGRIIVGGYEFRRLGPERWNEGVDSLTPSTLFARRLEEAGRAERALSDLVAALADSLDADARIELPPFVFIDEDTRELALERPAPTAPVPHFEIGFVLGEQSRPRVISSTYRMRPGLSSPSKTGAGAWCGSKMGRVGRLTSSPTVFASKTRRGPKAAAPQAVASSPCTRRDA